MAKVLHGDCLEIMPTMDADSVDAVVTDPPYGLSFMGKDWDHGVPGDHFWREALRVAKPGAHLLAFGGTRTFHRLACAIEDAGWEIRDTIMWVYGSGFPKSLDVSKAIDKAAGAVREVIGKSARCIGPSQAGGNGIGTFKETNWQDSNNITAPATESARQWAGWGTALKPAWEPIIVARKPLVGTVAENVQRYGTGAMNIDGCRIKVLAGERPGTIINTWEQEKSLCGTCANLAGRNAKRGTRGIKGYSAESHAVPTMNDAEENDRDDTSKADIGCSVGLSRAEQGRGRTDDFSSSIDEYGKTRTEKSREDMKSTTSTEMGSTTGLKICNACGCSITDQGTSGNTIASKSAMRNMQNAPESVVPQGRWPSNLIHDGSDEVVERFPDAKGQQGHVGPQNGARPSVNAYGDFPTRIDCFPRGDSGSAARFFYCAKASKSDREGSSHPTMKPTALMRYLCRLVTPLGGLVLDPFCGAGSTGKAAVLEGFRFTGIEMQAEYVAIADRRIAAAKDDPPEEDPVEQDGRQPELFR